MEPIRTGTDEVTTNYLPTNEKGRLTPTVGPCGYPNTAYRFHASQKSYLQIPSGEKVKLHGSFTMAMWIRRRSSSSTPLVEYGDMQSFGLHFWIHWNPYLFVNFMNSGGGLRSGFPVPMEKWTLVALSYNALDGKVLFFGNNQHEYKTGKKGLTQVTRHPLNIGARVRSGSDAYFDGDISSVMLFDASLTPREIKQTMPGCPEGKWFQLSKPISKIDDIILEGSLLCTNK
jgi:hypothetical protein